jgi:hypothetical protein
MASGFWPWHAALFAGWQRVPEFREVMLMFDMIFENFDSGRESLCELIFSLCMLQA